MATTSKKKRSKIEGLQMVSMRLNISDIKQARRIAAERGLGYQVYLRLLLHEALTRLS